MSTAAQPKQTARKNVVVFRRLPPDLLERIQARHEVIVADPRRAEELPRFRDALAQAQGLIGSSFKLGASDLATAKDLEVVSSISVGVDNYDLRYLKQRGITLCRCCSTIRWRYPCRRSSRGMRRVRRSKTCSPGPTSWH